MMLRYLAGMIFFLNVASALAGDVSASRIAQNDGASPAAGQPAKPGQPVNMAPVKMAEVAVGDHWTYEVRDEITGAVVRTQKVIVTDISGSQVATRLDVTETGRSGSMVFDKSWNVLRDGPNRYSPNSGTGVQSPLKRDAQWKIMADEVNGNNGNVWKIAVNSRVTGQESVTTKAGTFQTYTIETTQAVRSTKDPTANTQVSIRTWFSPAVNHWVRLTIVRRERGLTVRNETVELIEYGRKEAQ